MADIQRVRGELIVDSTATIGGSIYLGKVTTGGTSRETIAQGSASNISFLYTPKGTGTLKVPSGYAANITSDDDLVNRAFVNGKIGGQDVDALVSAPTVGEDGYAIIWDEDSGTYILGPVAVPNTYSNGLTLSAGNVKLGGNVADAATNVTQSAAGILKIRARLTDASDEAGLAVEAVGLNNNTAMLYAVGGSIKFTPTTATVTAPGTGALLYAVDYSANYSIRSLPDVDWVNKHIGGKNVDANILAPGGGEDQYVITWVNSLSAYKLIAQTGGGVGSGGVLKVPAVTTGGTITLDFSTGNDIIFVGSASFASAKTIALASDTTALRLEFVFTITNILARLTFPASFKMADARWETSVAQRWDPLETGQYKAHATYDGANWLLEITQAPYL